MNTLRMNRAEALRSLNFDTICAYMKKYGEMPPRLQNSTFWAGVHKARVMCSDMTGEEREYSRIWLRTNGWQVP